MRRTEGVHFLPHPDVLTRVDSNRARAQSGHVQKAQVPVDLRIDQFAFKSLVFKHNCGRMGLFEYVAVRYNERIANHDTAAQAGELSGAIYRNNRDDAAGRLREDLLGVRQR